MHFKFRARFSSALMERWLPVSPEGGGYGCSGHHLRSQRIFGGSCIIQTLVRRRQVGAGQVLPRSGAVLIITLQRQDLAPQRATLGTCQQESGGNVGEITGFSLLSAKTFSAARVFPG